MHILEIKVDVINVSKTKIGHCLILRRIKYMGFLAFRIKYKHLLALRINGKHLLAFRIKDKRLLALRKITQVLEKINASA
jgi:hypothetical protein